MKGAISPVHMYAGGYGTCTQMIKGEKFWLIGIMKPGKKLLPQKMINPADLDWQAIRQRAGDVLCVFL